MTRTFDIYALGLVALTALLVGYLIGRVVGGIQGAPPLPARAVTGGEERDEIRALIASGDRLGGGRDLGRGCHAHPPRSDRAALRPSGRSHRGRLLDGAHLGAPHRDRRLVLTVALAIGGMVAGTATMWGVIEVIAMTMVAWWYFFRKRAVVAYYAALQAGETAAHPATPERVQPGA